jgi:hypothetical protein
VYPSSPLAQKSGNDNKQWPNVIRATYVTQQTRLSLKHFRRLNHSTNQPTSNAPTHNAHNTLAAIAHK